jgi:hypothetical protein
MRSIGLPAWLKLLFYELLVVLLTLAKKFALNSSIDVY